MNKLKKDFYIRPALGCARDFLGKALVHQTQFGRISGIVYDVEAYPAFFDEVHHGNKRTSRTEIMWGKGGYAYVYLIYGAWHQFGAVVNKENIPDIVFVRAVMPLEGIDIMKKQWDRERETNNLTNGPGKLTKSLLITKKYYGIDLTGDKLFFEDWGIIIPKGVIQTSNRVGISSKYEGFNKPLRFFVDPERISIPKLSKQ